MTEKSRERDENNQKEDGKVGKTTRTYEKNANEMKKKVMETDTAK